ncbi:hypothetical protein EXIGLDRAFT_139405 [Exidia glandulosa HHB12029]|uniref:Uncharacterized protein n=1 Tax=Exidia glandulosa HHB12029 TaxID=1314781 RepID=A0A165FYB7_EXIGL|nr:hypothetical protein EXIGLDRAFT_139405 [Exidia glandulosa HHB12029]
MILGEHMWHISVLMLRFPNDLALLHFPRHLFSRPAPQLTTFMFAGRRNRGTGLIFDNLFAGHAPLLTDVIWEDSVSLGLFRCFSNVRRFVFRSFSCDATIWSILMRISPHLETLDVDIDVLDLSDWEPTGPEARYEPPKTLKQLSISATAQPYRSDDPFGLAVIAHASIPCVSLVGLDDSGPSDWVGVLSEIGAPAAADSVHVRADPNRLSLRWTDSAGRARALSNLLIVPLADLPFVSSPFGAIHNLTVHKWECLGERRIFPEFEALEVLSIVVDDDTFADPGTDMLRAPYLSTLRFATAKERVVSGSIVLSFMRVTLKIRHRLSSVEFSGLTLDGEDDCQTEIETFAQAVLFRPPPDVRFPTGEI